MSSHEENAYDLSPCVRHPPAYDHSGTARDENLIVPNSHPIARRDTATGHIVYRVAAEAFVDTVFVTASNITLAIPNRTEYGVATSPYKT